MGERLRKLTLTLLLDGISSDLSVDIPLQGLMRSRSLKFGLLRHDLRLLSGELPSSLAVPEQELLVLVPGLPVHCLLLL